MIFIFFSSRNDKKQACCNGRALNLESEHQVLVMCCHLKVARILEAMVTLEDEPQFLSYALVTSSCCDKIPETGEGGFKQHTFPSHRSGGWKSETRVPAWSGSGESSLCGWRRAAFLWVLTWQRERGHTKSLSSSS